MRKAEIEEIRSEKLRREGTFYVQPCREREKWIVMQVLWGTFYIRFYRERNRLSLKVLGQRNDIIRLTF